jgi:hypothetical protein
LKLTKGSKVVELTPVPLEPAENAPEKPDRRLASSR